MSKSSSGTTEKPGKKVRSKSGLNRAILDQRRSEFQGQFKDKLEWLGGVSVAVHPAYASQNAPLAETSTKRVVWYITVVKF